MSSRNFGLGPAAGEYSREDDNQLQPEDTLIDRGVDDVLDEGYSPHERPYGRELTGRRKASTSFLQRKSQIRCRESVTRSTPMNSSGPTKLSEKPSSRSDARLGACERVDLSRRTGGLAKTQKQSWWPKTSVSAGEQRLPKRPLCTSSTLATSSARAPFRCATSGLDRKKATPDRHLEAIVGTPETSFSPRCGSEYHSG